MSISTLTQGSLLDRLAAFCMLVAGVLLVSLILIFGWLVYGRYVLNDTPTWVEQAALLLVVYIVFLGAAVGVHRNTHLSIEFIRDALPTKPRAFLVQLSDILLIVFAGFMSWEGWVLISTNLNRAIPMLGLSESWRAAPLLISGLLILLFSSARVIKRFQQNMTKAQ